MVARVKTMTFAQCAKAYITAHRAGWRSARQNSGCARSKPTSSRSSDLPVRSIDTGVVMHVVEPLWASATETASREIVLDRAKTCEYRSGENPAR